MTSSRLTGLSNRTAAPIGDRGFAVAAAGIGSAAVVGLGLGTGHLAVLMLVPLLLAAAMVASTTSMPKALVLAWLALGPALVPFFRFPAGSSALVTFDRLVILGLAVTALPLLIDFARASRLTRQLIMWFVALFAVVAVRIIMGSPREGTGIKVLVDAFVLPVLVLLIVRASAEDEEDIDRMLLAFGLGGALAGALSLASWQLGFSLASLAGGVQRLDTEVDIFRYSGPFAVPEVLVALLLMSLAATMAWIRRGRGRVAAGCVILLFQLSGVFLAYFRTGWAVAILIVVGAILIRKGHSMRAFVGIAALVAVAYLAVGQLEQSQQAVGKRLANTRNTATRIAAYEQGLKIFESSPLAGIGIGGYPVVSQTMAPTWYDGVPNSIHPHNSFMQMLVEAGIFALIALLGVVITAGRVCVRLWRISLSRIDEQLGLAGILGLAGYLVFGFPFSLFQYGAATSALCVLLGLCCARLDKLTE